MHNFEFFQDIINKELQNSKEYINKHPQLLYEPIEYTLSAKGKRIRPVLVLMACNIFTDNYTHAIKPALGIEIFHNFTLLHDDIMDKSTMRRGKPTVHEKYNENIAILSGDAMSILAYKFIVDSDTPKLSSVLKEFSKMAIEVCEGQQYDMDFEHISNVTVEQYIEMITLKTAVLIAGSLKIGGILGGASLSDAEALYNLGINIGLAFQLQDDYLDTFGDMQTFGKKIGGDIVANKKTYLLIKALELAKGDSEKQLLNLINNTNTDSDKKILQVKAIYKQLGVEEYSKNKMNEYYSNAILALNSVNVDVEKKQGLANFAAKLMNREY